MQELTTMLKGKGLKVTPQRLAIFNVLFNTKEHPSAETIYSHLQPTHPTMSLATVYKTLDAFKKASLIQELNTGGSSVRYDVDITSHAHAVCSECEKVYDVYSEALDEIFDRVRLDTDFKFTGQKIYLYGTCADCK